MKLTTLAGKERTLQLAGTMALGKRKMSPLSKLRETRGMVTIKRVPDVFEQKNSLAQREEKKQTYEFVQKTDHEFLNYDTLAFGQKDFNLNVNVPAIENKHGLTVFDKRPKEYWDRVIRKNEREIEDEAATRNGKPLWQRAHQLPGTQTAIAQNL